MSEQIEVLQKSKEKIEQDRLNLEKDLNLQRTDLEESLKKKNFLERQGKNLGAAIVDKQGQLRDLALAIGESENEKIRLKAEQEDLKRQIEEAETAIGALRITEVSLNTQVKDTMQLAELDAHDKSELLKKISEMEAELIKIRAGIEEESLAKSDAMRTLSKATADAQLWKTMYETEGLFKVQELQTSRDKLNTRISEANETIDRLTRKVAVTQKDTNKLEERHDELQTDYEKMRASITINERRAVTFDKVRIN